jgi:hypothetical protein
MWRIKIRGSPPRVIFLLYEINSKPNADITKYSKDHIKSLCPPQE